MEEFKRKNVIERMTMDLKDLEEYYRELRKYEYESNVSPHDKEYYEKRCKILSNILKIEMKIFGYQTKIFRDYRDKDNEKPKIYAVTHIGRFDIESSVITKDEHARFLWGNPGSLYKKPEKILMNLLDPIFIDTWPEFREDCHIGQKQMVRSNDNGINVQIYPEGAYNIFPNKVVMRLFDGAVKTQQEGKKDADIIPVAITQYGKTFYVSYGENISREFLKKYPIKEATDILREKMATLKWEQIAELSGEKTFVGNPEDDVFYTQKRTDLSPTAYEEFIDQVMLGNDEEYNMDEIERTRYKDKNCPEPQEIENDLEYWISKYPAFFLSSEERFKNYIDVLNKMDYILSTLEEFRQSESTEVEEPIDIRLKKYKELKKNRVN